MNSFFSDELLEREEISDLPRPSGIIRAFYKGQGFVNPEVLVDASFVSSDYASMYAHKVFDYLKEKSFTHLYSVSWTNIYNTPLVSKYAYNLKEAVEFADFVVDEYYSGGAVYENPYVFVFSNGDFLENEDGNKTLQSAHCIMISREGTRFIEINDEIVNFSYTIELDINSSYWLMRG